MYVEKIEIVSSLIRDIEIVLSLPRTFCLLLHLHAKASDRSLKIVVFFNLSLWAETVIL